MKDEILPSGNLRLIVSPEERATLRADMAQCEDFHSDAYMFDFFDRFIANSEYEWTFVRNALQNPRRTLLPLRPVLLSRRR